MECAAARFASGGIADISAAILFGGPVASNSSLRFAGWFCVGLVSAGFGAAALNYSRHGTVDWILVGVGCVVLVIAILTLSKSKKPG
jgi:hypothetical protein